MSISVTVVVPTYNSGQLIDSLVNSMREQTMSRDEFEVLFADDGSTDGTPDRLETLAAQDPLFRVLRLPNSGWPGQPRNTAVAAARGEYVQFVDHDDTMGPEALERMYALGRRNRSDIVIGKVSSTHRLRGIPHALMSRTRESCTYRTAPLHDSLTVHKMYRTAFLREQGIVFPVGHYVGEDLLFMVPAVLRAASVSVVGDYPCYYYLEQEDGGNATPSRLDPGSYSGNLREIFDALLAETDDEAVRETWLRRFWRADLVKYLSEPIFPAYPPDQRLELFRALRAVAADYLPEGVYAGLFGLERARAALIRADRPDQLLELSERASGLASRAVVGSVGRRRERLRIDFAADFVRDAEGTPLVLRTRDGRQLLDPALTEGLDLGGPLDVSGELGRFRCDALLRHRDSAVTWPLPCSTTLSLEAHGHDADGELTVRPVIRGSVLFDPRRAAGGGPVAEGVWDLRLRVLGPGLDRYTRPTAGQGLDLDQAELAVAGLGVSARFSVGPEQEDGLSLLVRPVAEGGPRPFPAVSVVLPAAADPALLAASTASLAAQSLPADVVEVLYVGGPVPPGAAGRSVPLAEGAAEDPRDAGAAAARGEYLLFLTPGDRLTDRALERLYGYGLEQDADIVVGRAEPAEGRPAPAALFAADRPAATPGKDPLLDSLGADQLFHRGFLADHGLRFGPPGRPRAEQVFTLAGYLCSGRTSVLGGDPALRYRPGGTAETPAEADAGLLDLLDTVDRLTGPGQQRDRLQRHWLRSELLDRLADTALLPSGAPDRAERFERLRALLVDRISPGAVAGLSAEQRVLASLAAEGRLDELARVAAWERSLSCRIRLDDVSWHPEGTLRLRFTARLAADSGPVGVRPDQDVLVPSGLDPALLERFAAEPLSGTAAPGLGRAGIVLRRRADGGRHPLPTTTEVVRGGPDGGLAVTGEAVLDPAAAASGEALADGAWDLWADLRILGRTGKVRVGADRAVGLAGPLPARPHPDGSGRTVGPYWTDPRQELSLRVGLPRPGLLRRTAGRLHRALTR
ncbi:glycosyltransferase [Streptacidiphilus cavernicola]|uniref:Glycosyltransferase n=1 Tax=Streptacidiphilus cavernicola TaxID=3342716 RepID=A0ABV6VU45_9ACTN